MLLAIVYLCVFLCTLIVFEAALRFVLNRRIREDYVNQRMRLLATGTDNEIVYRKILKERGLEEDALGLFSSRIVNIIRQSGLHVKSSRLAFYALAISLAIFVVAFFLQLPWYFAFALTFICTPFVCFGILLFFRSRRMKRFLNQLPDSLDFMVRSIAAGHPIHTSVSLVAREMPDPIGTEFGILNDEMTYGSDIEQGAKNMIDRVGVDDLNFLAITLSVQRTSGGNLTEILNNLSDMLRRRLLLKQKVKAISAEGRMTSWFMLSYPFILYILIFTLSPNYFDPIWESGHGTTVLIVGAVLMIIGMLILRKIVNFDY